MTPLLRNALRKKYRKNQTSYNLRMFDIAEDYFNKHIKNKVNENFAGVTEDISKMKNLKKYKCIKNTNNSWDLEQQQDYLNHITGNASFTTEDYVPPATSTIPNLSLNHFKEFLNTKNLDSTPGIDNISYRMVKSLQPEEKNKIFQTLNNIWLPGSIPERNMEKYKNNTYSQEESKFIRYS